MSPAATTSPIAAATAPKPAGRITPIPGQPGESIDARLLPDLDWIIQTFKVKVTDGFARAGHAPDGEHPLGFAVDLVPDPARGGTWADVDRLARWAEPAGKVRDPFRWVGYTGDPGHGRGHHLHLSWAHAGGVPRTLPFTDRENKTFLQGLAAGPVGDAAAAGADAAAAAAEAGFKAGFGWLWGMVEKDALRFLLYAIFVGGGAALAVYGLAKMFGEEGRFGQVAKTAATRGMA